MSSLAKHVAVTRGIFFFLHVIYKMDNVPTFYHSFFFFVFIYFLCMFVRCVNGCVYFAILPHFLFFLFFFSLYSCYGCLVFGKRCFLRNVSVERIFCSECHVSPTILCQTMRRILQKTNIFHVQCISDFGEYSL